MRVLISTVPAHGHLLPLLPIARAALRAGHEVVVATGTEGVAEARRRGFDTWTVGPSRAEADAAFRANVPDLMAIPADVRMPTVIAGVFGAAAVTSRRRPGAAGGGVGARPRDPPDHGDGRGRGCRPLRRPSRRARPRAAARLRRGRGSAPGSPSCAPTGTSPTCAEGIVEAPYLDNCPPSLQPDTAVEFTNRMPIRPTAGDLIPGERLPWTDDVLDALPFDRTVHLTLGTIFHGAVHVFEAALDGLAELPVNVLVALGPGADLDVLGPRPPHVLVADFVPHELVLPRCAALVTQGGAGTIVAALCHGVPHLILPQGADQFVNAETAERAGVALQLAPQHATPAAIAAAVGRLLDDDSIAGAARAASVEVADMPSADEVLGDLLV